LVGNLATETIIEYLQSKGELKSINQQEFAKAMIMADKIFPKH
jgi:hydroxymethylglutaryl-CoA lyase